MADKRTSSSRIEEWIFRTENSIIELFVKGAVQAHITNCFVILKEYADKVSFLK